MPLDVSRLLFPVTVKGDEAAVSTRMSKKALHPWRAACVATDAGIIRVLFPDAFEHCCTQLLIA
jgi:hypothetical protein